jgi:hypothetical protein
MRLAFVPLLKSNKTPENLPLNLLFYPQLIAFMGNILPIMGKITKNIQSFPGF